MSPKPLSTSVCFWVLLAICAIGIGWLPIPAKASAVEEEKTSIKNLSDREIAKWVRTLPNPLSAGTPIRNETFFRAVKMVSDELSAAAQRRDSTATRLHLGQLLGLASNVSEEATWYLGFGFDPAGGFLAAGKTTITSGGQARAHSPIGPWVDAVQMGLGRKVRPGDVVYLHVSESIWRRIPTSVSWFGWKSAKAAREIVSVRRPAGAIGHYHADGCPDWKTFEREIAEELAHTDEGSVLVLPTSLFCSEHHHIPVVKVRMVELEQGRTLLLPTEKKDILTREDLELFKKKAPIPDSPTEAEEGAEEEGNWGF